MQSLIHSPLTRFIAQAIVILGLSRLIGLLARRVRQPMVIAEIVAGILLGPSLFGWLAPGVWGTLFAPESLPLLSLVSQVGLVLFMFLVGLEFDPALLRGRSHSSVVISHTSIIVPFLLGTLLALFLYPRLSDPSVAFSSFTLFMGAAMSVTAFPVLARILAEQRMTHTKIGAITIACAAVDDVTAWCILAFVVSITRATGIGGAIGTTALALVYIAAMIFVVRPFLAKVGARSMSREGLSHNVVAVTLLLLLLSSWATELIGIHALFGAFLFGAIMPRTGGFVSALAEKLEDLVLVLLLPLFFAYSGLRTQVGLLNSPSGWGMCAIIILVACLGKFGGSAVAARLTGLNWRESSALGVLMNTRGLMELVVLNVGFDLGVISPTLFTMMVLMALVTTFITTPLLRWINPPLEAEEKKSADAVATPMPVAPATAFTVLMCVGNERSGPAMVTLSDALTRRETISRRLYALRLLPTPERASFYAQRDSINPAGSALDPLLAKADTLGAEVRPLSFVSPDPASDICNVAEVKRANLVLLGWHNPVLSRSVLGGTVRQVLERTPADIGVLIDRGLSQVRKVLVPFQGTEHDKAALALARRLLDAGVAITVLHVVAPGRPRDEAPLGANAAVEQAFLEPGSKGPAVRVKTVEGSAPVQAALEEAARGYDLVVVGVGHEWGLERRLFGVFSERLIQQCPTSLLVVRHHSAEATAPVKSARGVAASAAMVSPHEAP
jgi:Kef-type K+ transport system membrane component KefB/nucleotide-binding universal stress UspA family protein